MTLFKHILNILPKSLQRAYDSYTHKSEIKRWQKSGGSIPSPLAAKENIINKYREKYAIDVFVETGTYYGDMVWRQRDKFTKIYSIELGTELAHTSKYRFRNRKHIQILQGDSGKKLPEILGKITDRAIIFLDAHYSGEDSVRGHKDSAVSDELPCILPHGSEHVIIINDAHLFKGERDYPALEAIERFVLLSYPNSTITVENNCIVIELKKQAEESIEESNEN